jgi:hypothetical protein
MQDAVFIVVTVVVWCVLVFGRPTLTEIVIRAAERRKK